MSIFVTPGSVAILKTSLVKIDDIVGTSPLSNLPQLNQIIAPFIRPNLASRPYYIHVSLSPIFLLRGRYDITSYTYYAIISDYIYGAWLASAIPLENATTAGRH